MIDRFGRGLFVSTAIVAMVAATPAMAQTRNFNVPAQAAETGIAAFGRQAEVQIVAARKFTKGKRTNAVRGSMTVEAALRQLLDGTGLTFRSTGAQTYMVVQGGNGDSTKSGDSTGGDAISSNEIVVTGTNIRGVVNAASPRATYAREVVLESGASTVQDFIQKLPQNFTGGRSEVTQSAVNAVQSNNARISGAGIDLRGLGSGSTLVLIDGLRSAPASDDGDFVDISLLPLAAVERVEVVVDGASAVYGSDAVGGVANFVLRRDFNGAETAARFGSVTEGNKKEYQVSQIVGTTWSGGSVLAGYEFYGTTALLAEDRAYTQNVRRPDLATLFPDQTRHSAFANFRTELGAGVELYASGRYAHRQTDGFVQALTTVPIVRGYPASTEAWAGSTGIDAKLFGTSRLSLKGGYSTSATHERTVNLLSSNALIAERKPKTSVTSIDGTLDGTLLSLPGGALKYAIGAQFRHESYDQTNVLSPAQNFQADRNVTALFVEINAPLFQDNDGRVLFEINGALRREHYSDFGSTTNPRLGLTFAPANALRVRGTYGRSFRAPLLSQLNPAITDPYFTMMSDPKVGASVPVAVINGSGNPSLGPERATTWTIGADYRPDAKRGFRASVSYYNIKYRDRIGFIQGAGLNLANALILESVLGPAVVQRNPSSEFLQQIKVLPNFVDFCPGGCSVGSIVALVDNRPQNLSVVQTDGLDFSFSNVTSIGTGSIEAGIDGTYIINFDNRFTPNAPVTSSTNKPYQPNKLRLRARLAYEGTSFNIAAFVNYTGAYDNTLSNPNVEVASFATIDFSFGYNFSAEHGPFKGLSLRAALINATNERPPFLRNSSALYSGFDFDGANASPLGRFASIQLIKRW